MGRLCKERLRQPCRRFLVAALELGTVLDHVRPVFAEKLGAKAKITVLESAERSERRMTASPKCPGQGPFRRDAVKRDGIADSRQDTLRARVVRAAFHTDHRLPGGRQHDLGWNCSTRIDLEPLETSRCKQGCVHFAGFNFAQPGFDIPPDSDDPQIGPQPAKLRCAPWRRSSDRCSLLKSIDAFGTNETIANVAPRPDCSKMNLFGPNGLDVLHRMDAEIHFVLEQRTIELLGPQRLAADSGERPVLDHIASRFDLHDLNPAIGPALSGFDCGRDLARLSQRQRRSASPETKSLHFPPLVQAGALRQRAGREMTIILGLESSCDDSAVALVSSDRRILAQAVVGQNEAHQPFGGVVPEIAARAHVEILPSLIRKVLSESGLQLSAVDAISATAGPGLIGGVMVALLAGKGLALAAGKPFLAINHLEGHALSPRLADPDLQFPYLLLLVSGGHCQLLEVRGVNDYRRLATTIDDAAGEAFDKAAKLLGLSYPGGPAVEQLAKTGNASSVPLPRPLLGSREPHFSFAGLKSAVQRAVVSGDFRTEDIAASFQLAVIDCLVDRTRLALEQSRAPTLVVAGGVAANQAIRHALGMLAADSGRRFSVPPGWLCTDNAAMIAWAGLERFGAGMSDTLDAPARARWPLDEGAEKVRGAGVKA